MSEMLDESGLRRSVICIKKQFLCATSVKTMHWEVNDMLILIDYAPFWNNNIKCRELKVVVL
jgi:hypothetical protein